MAYLPLTRSLAAIAAFLCTQAPLAAGLLKAHAQSNAYASTVDQVTTPLVSTGYVSASSPLAFSDRITNSNGASSSQASYNISAQIGTLRLTAQTAGSAGVDPARPYLFQYAGGQVLSFVEWRDTMTVIGPPGIPVQIAATIQMDATGDLVGALANYTSNRLDFRFSLPALAPVSMMIFNLASEYLYNETFILNLLPGSHNISSYLGTDVRAQARIEQGWPSEAGSGMFAGGTARMYLDVLTPGASYTLESGADLRSPPPAGVPETSTLALALCGMAAMSLRMRMQRRARR